MAMFWFKISNAAPTDPKWLGIARRAHVKPGDAFAVAMALAAHASGQSDRGSIATFDRTAAAAFWRLPDAAVDAVIAAMVDIGDIKCDRLARWHAEQDAAPDNSTPRVRRYREKRRGANFGGESPKSATKNESEENQRLASDVTVRCNGETERGNGETATELESERDSEAFASAGAAAPPGSVKDLFDRGVKILGRRGLLGKMRKQFGDAAVMAAIVACEAELPSDPAGFFVKCCMTHAAAGRGRPAAGSLEGALRLAFPDRYPPAPPAGAGPVIDGEAIEIGATP